MRSSFAIGAGAPLVRTPNARRKAAHRRLALLGAVAGLVMASALFGAVAGPGVPGDSAAFGPFSYFPSE